VANAGGNDLHDDFSALGRQVIAILTLKRLSEFHYTLTMHLLYSLSGLRRG
jgi:hypothetical protein